MKFILRQPAKAIILILFVTSLFVPLVDASALKQLSIEPITWNVIGLDSNNVSVGPNHFPIGARVCNTGDELVENVKSAFFFDTVDAYINLRPGTSNAYTADGIDLNPGECVDFYYEVEVDRDSNAYEHTREYHITASADATASVSTPQPRELFVEYLISQSRNSVSDVLLDGTSVPAGGTMNLVVGDTYEIQLVGSTATNGYEQIESFINFPNTIFQVLDVTTTYSADTSSYVNSPDDKLYGNGCLWENDPDNPNYQSCLDTGKVGGGITVTFDVRILSVPSNPLSNPQGLSTLIYDFSGSSFHYNSDYSVSTRYANIVTATITKAFTPKTIYPGDDSTLSFEITNPGENTISSVNFDDTLPPGISISSTTVTHNGCGGITPTLLSIGQTDLAFSGIDVAGLGTCTIDVTVTGSSNGVYQNISENLFIGTIDTGSSATDTLVISSSPPPPSSCPTPVTMATWSLENYTASTSFNTGPFNASSQAGDVTTAVGTYVPATGSNSAIVTSSTYPSGWDPPSTTGEDGNSWGIQGGWSPDGVPTDPTTEPTPYFQFQVDGSQYGGVGLTTSYNLQNNWSNAGNWYVLYSTDASTWSTLGTAVWDKSNSWHIDAISAVSTSAGDPNIYFRVYAAGAQYTGGGGGSTHAEMYLDNVTITGCPPLDLPTLSKAFSDVSIPQSTTTTLTFSLANPNSSDLTGVGFTDDLPIGLLIDTPNGLSQSCIVGTLTLGTITAASDTTYFELDGATLSANAVCTISIAVLGDVAGEYENISGNITSTETGPNTTSTGYGTDTLTVVDPPVISKSFGATFVLTGNSTSLNFSIANPNRTVALTGVAFTDDLPAGLDIADGTFSVCGGTNNLTTAAAGDIITLTGTTIAANDSCDFSVTVTGSPAGTYVNTTGNVTSTNGGTGNTASATIEVRDSTPLISLDKLVSDSGTDPWGPFVSVGTSSNVWFRFVVENTGDEQLSNVDVTDPAPYVDPSTCIWTDGDGDGLTAPFTLPVPTAANDDHIAICTIGPITSNSTVGSYSNTATATGTGTSTTVTDDSTATYANPEVTIVKTAVPAYYTAAAEVISYSFDVTNTGGVPLLGPVTIDDDRATDESCPSLTTVGDADNYLDPVDHPNPGDPAESITCTASYTITPADVTAGSVTNNASATVDSTTSNTDNETVYLAALTIDKDTTTPSVGANGLVVYTIEVVNTGQFDLTNFQVTDTLPFLGGEYSVQSTSASVTSGTINANGSYDGSGDTNLLAGTDTLVAGATATITINIQLSGASPATYDNTAVAITDQTGSIDDDGGVAGDPGTPGAVEDPEADEDVTVIAGGTITIIKDSVPDAAQDFTFTGTGPAGYDFGGGFSLDDDADPTLPNSQSFSGLSPGSYSVTEGAVSGWSLTGLSCVDPDSGSSVDLITRTATIDLDAGETVTCTYTNTQLGTIVVVKDSVPNDAQDFDFTGSGPASYDFGGGFSLDDDSDGTLPNTETFIDLLPGSYTVIEAAASGWNLTALSCVDPDSGSSVNVGTLTASIDLDSGETVTCTFTNTQQNPALTLVKSITSGDPYSSVGTVVNYQFVLTNSGNVTLVGPFTIADNRATDESCPVTATLAPSAFITCTASYTITQTDLDNGSVTNTATGSGFFGGNPIVSNQDSETANATQTPSVQVVKEVSVDSGSSWQDANSAPGPSLSSGTDPVFRFTVENNGNVTLNNLMLNDSDMLGNLYQSDLVTPCIIPGTLAPGVTFICYGTLSWAAGQHTNTATATGDFNLATYSDTDDANYFGSTAAYTITKTVTDVDGGGPSGSVDAAGDVITYQVVVTNTGSQDITGVSLADSLVASVGSPTESATANGILEVGETWTWTYTYTALQSDIDTNGGGDGDIDNTATVSSNELGDLDSSQAVPVSPNPAYSIVKSVTDVDGGGPSGSVDAAGDVIAYQVVVTNTGNQTLTGVSLTDSLVASVGSPTESISTNGQLDVGETWTWTYTYTALQSDIDTNGGGDGDIDNTATVSSNELGDQDSSQAVPVSQNPSLNIIKEVSDDNATWVDSLDILVGNTVYYRIRVQNTGNTTLTNLIVDDGMAGCTLARGSDLTGNDDNVFEVGEEWAYYCSLTAVVGFQPNTATADTDETPLDSDGADYSGEAFAYSIVKSVTDVDGGGPSGSVDAAGDVITYQVVVTNTGNQDITGVSLADSLVASVGSPTESATADGILEVGETWTWIYTYTALQSDIDTNGGGDGDIDNTATVSSNELGDQDSSQAVPVSPNPAYSIVKSVTDVDGGGPSGSVDAAGDVITYQVVVTNTGNQTITGVSLADSLVASVGSPTESITADGLLEVSETWSWTYTYTALQSDIDSDGGGDGDIDNTATVSSNELGDLDSSQAVPITQSPSYTIVKSVTDVDGGGPGGSVDAAGDVIAYQVVVTNTGNQTITGVSLADSLVASVGSPTESITADGNLELGETWTWTYTYTALQSDLDTNGGGDGDIDNTATVSSNELGDQDSSQAVPVSPNPAYSIVKSVTDVDGGGPSGSVDAAGDVIAYQVVVTNTGNQTITGVSLADSLVASVGSPAESISTNGLLDVGETWTWTYTYTALQSDIDNNGGGDGDIDNTATVSSNELGDQDSSQAVPVSPNPAYSIVKSVTDVDGGGPSGSVDAAGDVIAYQVVVTNTGNQTLTGVSLGDSLVASVGSPTESITADGNLELGETWTWTYTYTALQSDIDTNGGGDGDIDNTATVSSNELGDQDSSQAVPVSPNPAYSIVKSVTDVDGGGPSGSVDAAGDVITYQVVVTNTGNQTLTGVSLSDSLVASVGSPTESISSNSLLDVGETWTWTYTYTALQSDIDTNGGGDGDIDNTATVSSNELGDQDSSQAVTVSQNPAYTIVKSVTDVDGGGPSGSVDAAGDVIAYQVVVTNTGNQTLTGVSLADSLVASVGSPTESITADGNLELGETWTWTYTYTATQSDIDTNGGGDGDIDNTATVSSNELGDQDSSQAVPVSPNPAYSIVKSVTDVDGGGPSGSVDAAGDVITYQVVVTNTGNQTLTGVSLSDSLVASVGSPTESITTDGNLEVGETWTWTYTYTALQSDIDTNGGGDGDIDNTATVSSNELGDLDSSQAVPVSPNPAYSIVKSVTDVDGGGPSGSVDAAGDVIAYQVVVTNTGNQTITGVSLADSLVASVGSPAESISTNGLLDVGETWTWTYTYTALQSDIDNNGGGDGDIDNTATVSSNELGDQDSSQAVPVSPNPAYSIVKSVTDVDGGGPSGSVDAAGDVIAYQVVVTNTGNQTLTGVSLADSLVASVGSPTESITADGNLELGETWTWTYTYTALQSDIDTNGGGDGDIDNTATVSSNELGDQDSSQAVPVSQNLSLNIVKEVSDDNINWFNNVTVLVGDTVYYRVRVQNTGNSLLTGLAVSDPACTLARGADLTGDNDGDFEVGEVWAYYCNVTAVAGTQTNTATADSNETGPDTDSASYLGVEPPFIVKSFFPGTINAGGISTITFTITNPNASTDFVGVAFDDTFPTIPGAMVVASPTNASTSCGGILNAVPGNGSISFNGGAIPAGTNCTVVVDITAPTVGPYANFTTLVSATNGGVGNFASDSLLVGAAQVIDPAVTKTGDPTTAAVGDTVTFTLNVFNTENANALNVVVTDTLPSFLDYVSISAPGSVSAVYASGPHTVTITYATVQPTDFFTITITTVVNSSATPPGGTNQVDLTSLTPDSNLINNTDSTPIAIIVVGGTPAPDTGFAPNRITSIPAQPPGFTYLKLGELSIQIPVLGVDSSIVGVPLNEDGWDVTWLWDQIGYLDGTAFPGWDGNSVLTGHVYLPSGLAGPFQGLHLLTWGDRIIVNVYGTRYIYEVRESRLYRPLDNRIIRHEDSPWLTLITCQSFDEQSGEYRWRRVVRAVLIEVE